MYVMGITDAYDSFTNSTETIDDENDNINNITDFFYFYQPQVVYFHSLKGLKLWSTLKPLFS